MINLIIG